MARRTSRHAFTLVELVVSAAVLSAVLLLLGSALNTSAQVSRFDLARAEAMSQSRKVIQQLTRELSSSGGHEGGTDRVTPTRAVGGAGLTTITFAERIALTGVEANDWSATPITYRLVANGDTPGNGVDDDRDGVTDEQRLERVSGGQTVVLDQSVTLFTIDRALGSDMITITLEVSRPYRTAGVATTATDWVRVRTVTNVYLRNRV
jgi:type II secretory pathway pseudopilin PulG